MLVDPIASSCLGVTWLVARIVYTIGYTDKDKPDGKGRAVGNFFYAPELALQVLTGLTAYKLLVG